MYKFKEGDIVRMTDEVKVYDWYTKLPLKVVQVYHRPTVMVSDIYHTFEVYVGHIELDLITTRRLKIKKIKNRLCQ